MAPPKSDRASRERSSNSEDAGTRSLASRFSRLPAISHEQGPDDDSPIQDSLNISSAFNEAAIRSPDSSSSEDNQRTDPSGSSTSPISANSAADREFLETRLLHAAQHRSITEVLNSPSPSPSSAWDITDKTPYAVYGNLGRYVSSSLGDYSGFGDRASPNSPLLVQRPVWSGTSQLQGAPPSVPPVVDKTVDEKDISDQKVGIPCFDRHIEPESSISSEPENLSLLY